MECARELTANEFVVASRYRYVPFDGYFRLPFPVFYSDLASTGANATWMRSPFIRPTYVPLGRAIVHVLCVGHAKSHKSGEKSF